MVVVRLNRLISTQKCEKEVIIIEKRDEQISMCVCEVIFGDETHLELPRVPSLLGRTVG